MGSTKTRIRSLRRKANKHIDKKTNTVTIPADDFFWILTQIHVSENLEILEEENQRLSDRLTSLKETIQNVIVMDHQQNKSAGQVLEEIND